MDDMGVSLYRRTNLSSPKPPQGCVEAETVVVPWCAEHGSQIYAHPGPGFAYECQQFVIHRLAIGIEPDPCRLEEPPRHLEVMF